MKELKEGSGMKDPGTVMKHLQYAVHVLEELYKQEQRFACNHCYLSPSVDIIPDNIILQTPPFDTDKKRHPLSCSLIDLNHLHGLDFFCWGKAHHALRGKRKHVGDVLILWGSPRQMEKESLMHFHIVFGNRSRKRDSWCRRFPWKKLKSKEKPLLQMCSLSPSNRKNLKQNRSGIIPQTIKT